MKIEARINVYADPQIFTTDLYRDGRRFNYMYKCTMSLDRMFVFYILEEVHFHSMFDSNKHVNRLEEVHFHSMFDSYKHVYRLEEVHFHFTFDSYKHVYRLEEVYLFHSMFDSYKHVLMWCTRACQRTMLIAIDFA